MARIHSARRSGGREPPEGAAPRSGRDGRPRGSGALPFHCAPARSIDGYAIPYVEPLRSRVSVDQRHHELPLAGIGQVAGVAAYLNPLDRDLRASAGDSPAGERIGIAPKDDLMVPRRRPVMAPQVHRMEPAELVSHLHARSVVVFCRRCKRTGWRAPARAGAAAPERRPPRGEGRKWRGSFASVSPWSLRERKPPRMAASARRLRHVHDRVN